MTMFFKPGSHIHIIGVGGAGMSAIARILLERGHTVSGSDKSTNATTDALSRDGAIIYEGHADSNIIGAEMLIVTSAVKPDHIEVMAAHQAGIPVYKRRDILAPLMAGQTVIAVAGTHGKTTTTSLVTHLLMQGGLNPSYIVGGVMGNTGTNAAVGTGDLFVVEADEYDDMFLGLKPNTIVLTSIEYDHPDYFPSEEAMVAKFAQFVDLLQPGGTLIACLDYALVRDVIAHRKPDIRDGDIIGYSVREFPQAAMHAHNIRVEDEQTAFEMHVATGGQISINAGTVRVPLFGEHNAANTLAALTAADVHHIPFDVTVNTLSDFKSTGRRFELRGTAGGVVVIDDYAHHPTAVKLVCEAARLRYPDKPLWAVWQPHMYTRTQALIDDYKSAFDAAQHVIVTDVYAAREDPMPGVDGRWAADSIHHADSRHTGDINATADYLIQHVPESAVILIMSAGDAPRIGQRFLEARG